jgi:murein DD-endopeptidase MepM/ murein hydrolase activator NlpD
VAARRALNLETVPGLLATGMAAGLALSAAGIAAWLVVRPRLAARPVVPTAATTAAPDAATLANAEELRGRHLEFPVEGFPREKLVDTFGDPRTGHMHEASDILAPRNTPVRAVETGTIARLLTNASGGITIYQLDPSERFVYYYAHLERYADGLREGQKVDRGQVIGYVGTTGNAPRNTPHLHFAIFRVVDQRQWWSGAPINPYLVLR